MPIENEVGGPPEPDERSAGPPSRDLRNGDRHVRPANLLHLGVADIVEVSHHLREPRTRGVELRGGVGIRAATSARARRGRLRTAHESS